MCDLLNEHTVGRYHTQPRHRVEVNWLMVIKQRTEPNPDISFTLWLQGFLSSWIRLLLSCSKKMNEKIKPNLFKFAENMFCIMLSWVCLCVCARKCVPEDSINYESMLKYYNMLKYKWYNLETKHCRGCYSMHLCTHEQDLKKKSHHNTYKPQGNYTHAQWYTHVCKIQ